MMGFSGCAMQEGTNREADVRPGATRDFTGELGRIIQSGTVLGPSGGGRFASRDPCGVRVWMMSIKMVLMVEVQVTNVRFIERLISASFIRQVSIRNPAMLLQRF